MSRDLDGASAAIWSPEAERVISEARRCNNQQRRIKVKPMFSVVSKILISCRNLSVTH